MKKVDSAISNLISIIDSAKKEVRICSGQLGSYVYDHPVVLSAVENALKRGVKVTIIVGPKVRSTRFVMTPGIDVYCAHTSPVLHFAVADSKKLRLEEPSSAESDNLLRSGDTASAEYLKSKFEQALEYCTKIKNIKRETYNHGH